MRLIIVFVCLLYTGMCGPLRGAEEIPTQQITVKYGDTLWSVANTYLKDPTKWPEILKHNRMNSTDPNVILPGMTLQVPVVLIKESLRNAELISMLNDVRYRRNNETLFKKADLNMKLFHRTRCVRSSNRRRRYSFLPAKSSKSTRIPLLLSGPTVSWTR